MSSQGWNPKEKNRLNTAPHSQTKWSVTKKENKMSVHRCAAKKNKTCHRVTTVLVESHGSVQLPSESQAPGRSAALAPTLLYPADASLPSTVTVKEG